MSIKKPEIILWGGGSKARIIQQMIVESALGNPKIIFDDTIDSIEFETNAQFLNNVEQLKQQIKSITHYVVCIGAENGYARFNTAQSLEKLGLKPISLIHYTSFIDPSSSIESGCQIMPCAVIHKFTKIGMHTIINTNATVDHECIIGNGVHVMGNAAIAGKVKIGNYATIGTNATILPYVNIGQGAFVGAGSVVTKNIEPHTVVAGVPARPIRKNELFFMDQALTILVNSDL